MKRTFAFIAVLGLSAMLVVAAGCGQSDQEAHAEGSVESQPMMGEGAEYEGKVVTAAHEGECTGDCTEECIETCMAENAKKMPADEAAQVCAEECAKTCASAAQASTKDCSGCPHATASGTQTCSVCDCGQAVGTEYSMNHEGTTYYFCSAGCRNRFSDDPGKYLQ
jgi:YHS domain-containing protein